MDASCSMSSSPFLPLPEDSVSESVFRSLHLEIHEEPERYQPGGHHPVSIGDVLEDRFRVIHKLGHGGSALVWLAQDLHLGENVALKILKSDVQEKESTILKYLRSAAPRLAITHLRDMFTIRGPNGLHQCLVVDIGGPSLEYVATWTDEQKLPSLSVLKSVAQGLVEGLADLHAVGVSHGDLSRRNVLFELSPLRHWTEEEIYLNIGAPRTAPLLLADGSPAPSSCPRYIVNDLDYSQLDMSMLSPKLLITDFSDAFFIDNPPPELETVLDFLAPELLFGSSPSYQVDLWALGCLIFEIHAFKWFSSSTFDEPVDIIDRMVNTLGPLPENWQGLYIEQDIADEDDLEDIAEWFDHTIERTETLDGRISKWNEDIPHTELVVLVHLLKSLLVYEPDQRLSAREAAKHPWFITG